MGQSISANFRFWAPPLRLRPADQGVKTAEAVPQTNFSSKSRRNKLLYQITVAAHCKLDQRI